MQDFLADSSKAVARRSAAVLLKQQEPSRHKKQHIELKNNVRGLPEERAKQVLAKGCSLIQDIQQQRHLRKEEEKGKSPGPQFNKEIEGLSAALGPTVNLQQRI